MIQSFNIKLERVTLRGLLKLSPPEVIDSRLGRSINQFIHKISLSINKKQDKSSLPLNTPQPSLMDFKCGRSICHSFKSFKYLTSLLIRSIGMFDHLIQSNSNEEDLFITYIISIIPLTINEE